MDAEVDAEVEAEEEEAVEEEALAIEVEGAAAFATVETY